MPPLSRVGADKRKIPDWEGLIFIRVINASQTIVVRLSTYLKLLRDPLFDEGLQRCGALLSQLPKGDWEEKFHFRMKNDYKHAL